jgi:hypothetical protein
MGQAKQRKAEIEALKAQGTKAKPSLDGYRPDAGFNSQEGTNYYWLQVGEMIQATTGVGARSYTLKGQKYLEVNTPVDIMNFEGDTHLAPKTADGYFATLRFTPELLEEFSEQIAKGAMSIRVAGVPAEVETSPAGEQFRIIDVQSSWSAGNTNGFMSYGVMTRGRMIMTDSQKLSAHYKSVAANLVAQ